MAGAAERLGSTTPPRRLWPRGLTLAVAVATALGLVPFVTSGHPIITASADPPTYSQVVVGDGPVSYWRLNETSGSTAHDQVGSNPGSIAGGVTLGQSGPVPAGGSIYFNGSGVVGLGRSSSLAQAGNWSVESWFKTTNANVAGGYGSIWSVHGYGVGIGVSPSGISSGTFWSTSSASYNVNTDVGYADNAWHHLVVVRDTSSLSLYADGGLVMSNPTTESTTYYSLGGPLDGVFIGQAGNCACSNFTGSIAEVALYPTALSSTQVSQHYSAAGYSPHPPNRSKYMQAVLADTPNSYWRLDETAGRTAWDSRGQINAGFGNGESIGQPGPIPSGASYSFNGTGGIPLGKQSSLALNTWAVELWLKATSGSQPGGSGAIWAVHGYGASLYIDNNGVLSGGLWSTDHNSYSVQDGGYGDGQWHHVVLVRESGALKLYADGSPRKSTTTNESTTFYSFGGLQDGVFIGQGDGASDYSFKGSLAEFAYYGAPLSAAQVLAHYTASGRPAGGSLTRAESGGGGSPSEPCACHSRGRIAKPIDTASGDFYHTFADLSIPGRGLPVNFDHTYNSPAAGTTGPLGYGWTHSYAMSLTQSGTVVTINEERGSQITFTQTGSTYSAAPRVAAALVKNGDGTFTFTRRAREIFTFSSTGQLTSEKDLNGYTTTLTYTAGQLTSISDPAGRALTLAYTGALLTSITDPTNRKVTFAYNDGLGNLTDVTDVNGGITHFTYDASHRLLTMQDPRGGVVTNHYDAQGRVDWQTDELNRKTSFAYSGDPSLAAAGGTTTITDPKGNVSQDQYLFGKRIAVTKGYGTPAAATWTYTYDPATLGMISTGDPNGHASSATYDASGNVLTVTDALGRQTVNTYDSLNDLLTTQDPKGVTTTMTYDAKGNLLTRSTPLVGSSPLQARVTTYQHTDSSHTGDMTGMVDPDNKTWTYTYDSAGDMTSAADPLGDKTTYTYNGVGWKTSMVSPRGNVAGCSCASQYTTTYDYTDLRTGNVNGFGDVGTTTDPLGHTVKRTYDANRNVIVAKDGDGNTTQFTYDLANEQTVVTRADSTTLKTDYNADGTTLDQVDGAGNVTTYAYDVLARVTSVSDPLHRATSYTFDPAGNRLTMVDPQASPQTTTYAYDAANELTSISYSDGTTPNVTGVQYDADGQRTQMTDGTGTSTWAYDSLHRMTSSRNGAGATLTYSYDLKGQLTSLGYPSGTVTRAYDAAGRVISISDWLGHTTTFTPDANSNVSAEVYPNNTTATSAFDAADRLMAISDAPTGSPTSPFATFSYGRDGNNQVSSVSSTGVPQDNNAYGYTPVNQLGQVNSGAYGYDHADNLINLLDGSAQSYDPGNQLSSKTPVITLVGSGSSTDPGPSTSLTVTFSSAAQQNDQILLAVDENNGVTATAPGYTAIGTYGPLNGGEQTQLFRRTATGGESSVVVSFNQGTNIHAKAITAAIYRGVDPTNPIEVSSWGSTDGGTQVGAPSVSTTTAGDRLVMVENALNNTMAATWTPPAGMTTVVQGSNLPLVSAALADKPLPAAGATGGQIATLSQSASLIGVLLALKPNITTFTYDTRGNRTGQTTPGASSFTYGYDQANRLTSFGATATYRYDGDGLRASKTVSGVTTAFTWDVAEGLPLLLSDGTNSYIYGPGQLLVEQIGPAPVISLAGTGSTTDAGTSTSLTVSFSSAAQQNDQILLAVDENNGDTATPPSGYTAMGTHGPLNGGEQTQLFRRTASGGESSVVVGFNQGAHAKAITAAIYRGVDPTNPIEVSSSGSTDGGTQVTAPSVSTTTAGDRLVMVENALNNTPATWTPPAGMTTVVQASNLPLVSAALADKTLSTVGGTGSQTATLSQSASLIGVLLALKPLGPVHFYHHDQLGSTRVITDAAGRVAATYTYDPYGNLTASTSDGTVSNSLLFAGQYTDPESGLQYLRARYYDSATGSFLSRDPLVAKTRTPYAYVGDNPLNGTDPSGQYLAPSPTDCWARNTHNGLPPLQGDPRNYMFACDQYGIVAVPRHPTVPITFSTSQYDPYVYAWTGCQFTSNIDTGFFSVDYKVDILLMPGDRADFGGDNSYTIGTVPSAGDIASYYQQQQAMAQRVQAVMDAIQSLLDLGGLFG